MPWRIAAVNTFAAAILAEKEPLCAAGSAAFAAGLLGSHFPVSARLYEGVVNPFQVLNVRQTGNIRQPYLCRTGVSMVSISVMVPQKMNIHSRPGSEGTAVSSRLLLRYGLAQKVSFQCHGERTSSALQRAVCQAEKIRQSCPCQAGINMLVMETRAVNMLAAVRQRKRRCVQAAALIDLRQRCLLPVSERRINVRVHFRCFGSAVFWKPNAPARPCRPCRQRNICCSGDESTMRLLPMPTGPLRAARIDGAVISLNECLHIKMPFGLC